MEDVDTRQESDLYNADFYAWTRRQAELLRAGRLDQADLANIIEELESLGRSEYHALRASYRLVAMHLLKMRFQPGRMSESWRMTVIRERNKIEDSLQDNPGLRPKRAEILKKAYSGARREAAGETRLGLQIFPAGCPFTPEEIEDHEFWP